MLNQRPTIGQWLEYSLLDIFTVTALVIINTTINALPPAYSRLFPVYDANGTIIWPSFAYPLRKQIVPSWAAVVIGTVVPSVVILLMQIRIRSFWDFNNAVCGIVYAVLLGTVSKNAIKWVIGGLRPHFYAVCKPDLSVASGTGFQNIMYDRSICTGDKQQINNSLESFPSGHSNATFAGFVFLYLYLNAKLKVWANYHPKLWKLVLAYLPLLAAVLISATLTIDGYHNWYDVMGGAFIGTFMAFGAFRMVYASIFDFRFNHIPLTRFVPFTYTTTSTLYDSFSDTLLTRECGWGQQEIGDCGGAPFDVAGEASRALSLSGSARGLP